MTEVSTDLTDALGDLVERFDHVSMAVYDIEDTLTLVALMGGEFRAGGDVDSGFRWIQFDLPGRGKLEIIQPLDPTDEDNFLVKFLAERGEGLHHLTFKVADLDAAVAQARAHGFDVIGVSTAGAWKEAFVHPKTSKGVLIQLAQFEDNPFPPQTIQEVLDGTRGPDS